MALRHAESEARLAAVERKLARVRDYCMEERKRAQDTELAVVLYNIAMMLSDGRE